MVVYREHQIFHSSGLLLPTYWVCLRTVCIPTGIIYSFLSVPVTWITDVSPASIAPVIERERSACKNESKCNSFASLLFGVWFSQFFLELELCLWSILCQAMCHVLGVQGWLTGCSVCQAPLILMGGETETEHFNAIWSGLCTGCDRHY